MDEIHDRAEALVETPPPEVFDLITDPLQLPDWNQAIDRVVEAPTTLSPGAEWTVKMRPLRFVQWDSRSTVQEIDPEKLRFSYRTVNADGNPSYALWTWELDASGSGTRVKVAWDVHLETLDRKLLAGPMRCRQLRREVAASLVAIDAACRPHA